MTGEFLEYEDLMRKIEIECQEYRENIEWFKQRIKRISA
jgi:hypothetical protein